MNRQTLLQTRLNHRLGSWNRFLALDLMKSLI